MITTHDTVTVVASTVVDRHNSASNLWNAADRDSTKKNEEFDGGVAVADTAVNQIRMQYQLLVIVTCQWIQAPETLLTFFLRNTENAAHTRTHAAATSANLQSAITSSIGVFSLSTTAANQLESGNAHVVRLV